MSHNQSSVDIKRDISIHIDPFRDVEHLKAAVLVWVDISDGSLSSLDSILREYTKAYQGNERAFINTDEYVSNQKLAIFPYDDETFQQDKDSCTLISENSGVSNESVSDWLETWGTDDSSPCPFSAHNHRLRNCSQDNRQQKWPYGATV